MAMLTIPQHTTSPAAQEGELSTRVLEPASPDSADSAAFQDLSLRTPPYPVWEMGSVGLEL